MLDGFKNLFASEKAIAGGALIVCATVLVAIGAMTIDQWTSYTQVIFLGYAGTKTIQGAVAAWAGSKRPEDKTTIEVKTTTKTTPSDMEGGIHA